MEAYPFLCQATLGFGLFWSGIFCTTPPVASRWTVIGNGLFKCFAKIIIPVSVYKCTPKGSICRCWRWPFDDVRLPLSLSIFWVSISSSITSLWSHLSQKIFSSKHPWWGLLLCYHQPRALVLLSSSTYYNIDCSHLLWQLWQSILCAGILLV